MDLRMFLAEIDQKKAVLDRRRPFPVDTEESIHRAIRLDWTYHSNALAGSWLSLRETQFVLEGPATRGDEVLRQRLEAMNHAKAVERVGWLAERQEPLSEAVACRLHTVLFEGIDDDHAGKWRTVPVAISGSRHLPPPPGHIFGLLRELFDWYSNPGDAQHPVVRAARLNHRFLCIRPFMDGNGRIARLIMNLGLMSQGYPPAIIKADQDSRIAYLDALETASIDKMFVPLDIVVAQSVLESLDRYLAWTNS
jgi:Fic family protein